MPRRKNGYLLVNFMGPVLLIVALFWGGTFLVRMNWSAIPSWVQVALKVVLGVVVVLAIGLGAVDVWRNRGKSRPF